jgi:uncharacterized membrane protein YvbJ
MFCSSCGTQYRQPDFFCSNCGRRLGNCAVRSDSERLLRQVASDVRFISGGGIPWKLVGLPALLVLGLVAICAVVGLLLRLAAGLPPHS